MAGPAKGKARMKIVTNPKTGRKMKVSYGQAGKAKGKLHPECLLAESALKAFGV